jgi:hypothetical protein
MRKHTRTKPVPRRSKSRSRAASAKNKAAGRKRAASAADAEVAPRDEVKPLVVRALARESGRKLSSDDSSVESYRLDEDLGLRREARGALKKPFNEISEPYGGYVIFSTECIALKNVGGAVELVYRKANRK